MLILVYLVCMLSQADSVSSSDNNDVYPMESSEKLMLTIPAETREDISFAFNGLSSTTEAFGILMDNSISKDDIDIGTDSFFPIQELTTSPMSDLDETTTSIIRQEELPATTIIVTTSVQEITTKASDIILTSTDATDTEAPLFPREDQDITTTEASTSFKAHVIPAMVTPAHISAAPIIPASALPETNILEHDTPAHVNPETAIPEIAILKHTISTPAIPETHVLSSSVPAPAIQAHDIPEPAFQPPTIPATSVPIPAFSAPSIITPNLHSSTLPAVPFKRSLSLEELKKFENTGRESTTEAQIKSSTSTIDLLEKPNEEIQNLSTNLLTSSHPDDNDEDVQQSNSTASAMTIPSPVSDDDLFMDNWANNLSNENEDIQHDSLEEPFTRLKLMEEPTKSLFQNEDSELSSIEAPILKKESNDSLDSNPLTSPPPPPLVSSDVADDTSYNRNHNIQEPYKMFSPQNLLNLFTFDHQPSPSNIKATWWPKPKSSTLAENAAKSHRKRANRVLSNDDSQDRTGNPRMFNQMPQLQGFDTMLNAKLKNSVSMLEKLFGNFLQ